MVLFVADALALWLMSNFISHISFDKPSALVLTAVVLTILQKIVTPVLKFLSFPISFLTLGLFNLVINAFVLYLAFKFVDGANIDSHLGSLVVASVILSIIVSSVQYIL